MTQPVTYTMAVNGQNVLTVITTSGAPVTFVRQEGVNYAYRGSELIACRHDGGEVIYNPPQPQP